MTLELLVSSYNNALTAGDRLTAVELASEILDIDPDFEFDTYRHVIDIEGSEGNVFVVLGIFKRWLDKNTGHPNYDEAWNDVYQDYTNMKYEDIVDSIENLTNGEISFVNRYW